MLFLLSNSLLTVTLLVTVIIYLIYRYMTRNFDYWKERNVVYVPPVPILGNFGEFLLRKKSVGPFLQGIHDYAPSEQYVGFFGFDKPMLLIRDPDLIKQILIKDFEYFKDRYADAGAQDQLGTSNLFIIKNPAWKYLRTKITPIYTSGRLKKMFELMVEVGQDLVTHMKSLNLKGKTFG